MSCIITKYFLGANTPAGFCSLYDGFVDTKYRDTLYVIKGGPGCGKSSFMRRIADGLHKAGASVEYICCSGDPDSIDGVYFPELKLAYVDGTAPHEGGAIVHKYGIYSGLSHFFVRQPVFYILHITCTA